MKLLETIRYEDGACKLLDLHEERMLRSLTPLAPASRMLDLIQNRGLEALLDKYLAKALEDKEPKNIYKLRLIYDANQVYLVEANAYTPLAVDTLVLYRVGADFNYEHKFLDRACLNPFESSNNNTNPQVRIPLFLRDGLLTDTSFSNVVLRFGNELLTPEQPLLRGVMREQMLREGKIREQMLGLEALEHCDEVLLINAMLPLERAISVKQINH